MYNSGELLPEDHRLIADLNDPALLEAFNMMRELQRLRRLYGLSEEQVAGVMGTGQSAVNEMGRCDPAPSVVVVARFALALGVEIGVRTPAADAYVSRHFQYPPPDQIHFIQRTPQID